MTRVAVGPGVSAGIAPSPEEPVRLRDATAADAALLARLHAESWVSAYAGLLDPAYLAGPVEAERRRVWETRMADASAATGTVVAERDGQAVGFVCAIARHDPRWGTLIDNLHVRPGAKRGGLGRMLMGAAARWALRMDPRSGLYLWCLVGNEPARRFYERQGGSVTAREPQPMPDGSRLEALRFCWADPGALLGPGEGPR